MILSIVLSCVACGDVSGAPIQAGFALGDPFATEPSPSGTEPGESSDGGEPGDDAGSESSGQPAPEAEPDLLDLGGGTEYGEIPDTETETGEPAGPPCEDHWTCKDLSSSCGHGFCGLNGCEVLLFSDGLECIEDGVTGACTDGVCVPY